MYPLRCKHLSPFLTGLQFTTTGGASVVVDKGSNDFPSAACAAAGKVAATQAELGLFSRGPMVFCTPGANVADGGFGIYNTVAGSDVITAQLLGAAGSGDDGSGHILAVGFGNADTNRFEDAQIVRSTMNGPILMAWHIANPSGTVSVTSGGRQASVVRDSQGVVTLTLTPAQALIRAAHVSCINAAARSARITACTGETITVKTCDKDGVAQDSSFVLWALVSSNSDESGRCRDMVRVPQLSPELVVGRIVTTAGTPALTIGGATDGVDASIVDDGAGIYTVTLAAAGLRAVLPIACGKATRAQFADAPSTSAFQILCFDATGVAADDDVDFAVLVYNATSDLEF